MTTQTDAAVSGQRSRSVSFARQPGSGREAASYHLTVMDAATGQCLACVIDQDAVAHLAEVMAAAARVIK